MTVLYLVIFEDAVVKNQLKPQKLLCNMQNTCWMKNIERNSYYQAIMKVQTLQN